MTRHNLLYSTQVILLYLQTWEANSLCQQYIIGTVIELWHSNSSRGIYTDNAA